MNEHETHNSGDDLVNRAVAAVRDGAVPDGPDEALLARTLAAVRAAEGGVSTETGAGMRLNGDARALRPSRGFPTRGVVRFAMAACLVLAVGAGLYLVETFGGGHTAFAQVVERVNAVKSVRFRATTTLKVPTMAAPQTVGMRMTIVGNRMRQEMGGMVARGTTRPVVVAVPEVVNVMDMTTGEGLTLVPVARKAIRMKMENVPAEMKRQNMLEQFRTMKPGKGKAVGRERVGDRDVDVFEVVEQGQLLKVWADAETRYPVRMEVAVNVPMVPKTTVVMDEFAWDVAVDESEMALEVPAGYTVQEMTLDASTPTEKDLIEGLRTMAELNGGAFVDSFDQAGMMQAVKGVKDLTNPAAQQAMMDKVMKISRGMMFAQPATGDEFYYAGKGARLGKKGRAVMWYRPKGKETYRVVDAALNVTEVGAEGLPKLEAKKVDTATLGMSGMTKGETAGSGGN